MTIPNCPCSNFKTSTPTTTNTGGNKRNRSSFFFSFFPHLSQRLLLEPIPSWSVREFPPLSIAREVISSSLLFVGVCKQTQ